MILEVNIVRKVFRFIVFLFFALLIAGIFSCTLIPSPPTHKSMVWILDNADPDYGTPPFEDTLTVITNDGSRINTITGINIDQTIGGNRRIAVSPDGTYALIAVSGPPSPRLLCFEVSGKERWSLNRRVAAVDFPDPHNAYVLTTTGTIYGEAVLRIDPWDGRVIEEVDQGGFDLVVDREHGAIWIVGADIKKLNLAMERELLIDPIGWSAVSVDFTSDGSIWVAERAHPNVPGSANRLLKVSLDGNIVQTVPLDFSPFCVRVDRSDNSLWVCGGGKIHKFGSNGSPLLAIAGPSFTLCVDQVDGSVWAAGWAGQVVHYASTGGKLLTVSGFSGDQAWIDSN